MLKSTARALRILACAAVAIGVSGCATTSTKPQESAAERSSSRAERVFLYQSRVADALLDHYPLVEVFAKADPVLVAAEKKMTRKCSPLTRAMLTRIEGDRPSLLLRLEVFTSLSDCERAARRIDRLLNGNDDSPRTLGSI
ncbi:MAG: hypothetical protein WD928_08705 [Gammaproteobacteria bacterium]